jgi:hypothetical protein
LQIIKNLAGKRLDPLAVQALLAVHARGEIKIQRFTIKRPIAPAPTPAAESTPESTPAAPAVLAAETAALEKSRV